MNTVWNGLGLTDKQKRFCEEYVVDLSVAQAAVRSGCSAKRYNHVGSKMMKHPLIKQYIAELQAQRSMELCVSAREVVLELIKIAFADPANYLDENGDLKPLGQIPRAYRSAISIYSRRKGESTLKLLDKLEALKLLGRHFGIFGNEQVIQNDTLILIRPQGNPYADKS